MEKPLPISDVACYLSFHLHWLNTPGHLELSVREEMQMLEYWQNFGGNTVLPTILETGYGFFHSYLPVQKLRNFPAFSQVSRSQGPAPAPTQ